MSDFTDALRSVRFGVLIDDLDDALKEVVNACAETGKVGTLSLTLKLKPGKGGQIEVFDEVKIKVPENERGSTLMFPTPEGRLQRNNPRQMDLEGLRVAAAPAQDLRTLPEEQVQNG